MSIIEKSKVKLDVGTGKLSGKDVLTSTKRLKDLRGVFKEEDVRKAMDPETVVYSVQAYLPVEEGKPGGLFFGNSTIYPGEVAGEYFMTRGHFHKVPDTAEYYWCITGEGLLLMMDEERHLRSEKMEPGSLHYIPGKTAHRVVNTGAEPLVFNACWPSDAGHDYTTIDVRGFSVRVLSVDGRPKIITEG